MRILNMRIYGNNRCGANHVNIVKLYNIKWSSRENQIFEPPKCIWNDNSILFVFVFITFAKDFSDKIFVCPQHTHLVATCDNSWMK